MLFATCALSILLVAENFYRWRKQKSCVHLHAGITFSESLLSCIISTAVDEGRIKLRETRGN